MWMDDLLWKRKRKKVQLFNLWCTCRKCLLFQFVFFLMCWEEKKLFKFRTNVCSGKGQMFGWEVTSEVLQQPFSNCSGDLKTMIGVKSTAGWVCGYDKVRWLESWRQDAIGPWDASAGMDVWEVPVSSRLITPWGKGPGSTHTCSPAAGQLSTAESSWEPPVPEKSNPTPVFQLLHERLCRGLCSPTINSI